MLNDLECVKAFVAEDAPHSLNAYRMLVPGQYDLLELDCIRTVLARLEAAESVCRSLRTFKGQALFGGKLSVAVAGERFDGAMEAWEKLT